MDSETYPKGTTKEQWDIYIKDLQRHEQFISNYKLFVDRICNYLDWAKPNHLWTTEQIREVIGYEIDKSESMDAPNKPGYYRANND